MYAIMHAPPDVYIWNTARRPPFTPRRSSLRRPRLSSLGSRWTDGEVEERGPEEAALRVARRGRRRRGVQRRVVPVVRRGHGRRLRRAGLLSLRGGRRARLGLGEGPLGGVEEMLGDAEEERGGFAKTKGER